LLPSVPPFESVYSKIPNAEKSEQITWVGSINKQGLRRWALAMQDIMEKYKNIQWLLCVPSYDRPSESDLPFILRKLKLQADRIRLKNLSLEELAVEIKKSKILLCSLGGEDGPVSYLDGHALGVPVLCGDDIYGKYYNPEGTGLRCTNVKECFAAIDYILGKPEIAYEMGINGVKWIEENLTEKHQENYLRQIISFLQMIKSNNLPLKSNIQSDKKFNYRFFQERLQIKLMQNDIFKLLKK